MLKEKAEYLRGLADGLDLASKSDDSAKLFRAIIECISDIAHAVDDNTDELDTLGDDVEEIFETIDVYDEILFNDDDDDDLYDDDCDCDDCGDCDCDDCDCDDCEPNVVCSSCGEEIPLDELLNCPKCRKPVFGDDEDEGELKL